MGSKVSVNGNTFEEKGGKLYLNGAEISTSNSVTVGYPWVHVLLAFFTGFAVSGMLAKAFGA
jgi:hypothetical protein